MRFKIDRLCELAGIPTNSKRGIMLREGKDHDQDEGEMHEEEDMSALLSQDEDMHNEEETDEGSMHYEAEETDEGSMHYEEAHDDLDEEAHDDLDEEAHDDLDEEEIEVDEVTLVQELRRAKRMMKEARIKARRKNKLKKQALKESELRSVIDQEVKNIFKEYNLNSSWVYGKNKPTKSKEGYTHQGSFLKGIGFK